MKKVSFLLVCTAIAVLTHQHIHAQWSLTGNAGTTPNTNFIGTTDAKAFVVRTNNVERLRVAANGTIGINIKSGLVALLDLRNTTEVNSVYVTNTSTNSNQWGVRASVNGTNASAFRTGGEFSASGQGSNNTGVNVTASAANMNYGGSFSGTDGATSNIGVSARAGGPTGSTNYAVFGTISGFSNGRDYAGYFDGKTYSKGELIVGVSDTATGNSALSVKSAATVANSIKAINSSSGGNGIYVNYTGTPANYYGVFATAPTTGSNLAGYFSGNVTVTGTFSNPSDERLKDNIKPLENVIDKIMQVGVNTYNFKKEYSQMNLSPVKQYGFLAQNIEKQFPELVQTIVDKSKGENNLFSYKTVNYIAMIPILTKALQEEHAQRMKTEEELQSLKEKLDAIESTLSKNTSIASLLKAINGTAAKLEQNAPNPANQKTTISCYVPFGVKSAMIVVYSASGNKVKEFSNLSAGPNRVELNANMLAGGAYTYVLLIDGKQIDNKQMIVTK